MKMTEAESRMYHTLYDATLEAIMILTNARNKCDEMRRSTPDVYVIPFQKPQENNTDEN